MANELDSNARSEAEYQASINILNKINERNGERTCHKPIDDVYFKDFLDEIKKNFGGKTLATIGQDMEDPIYNPHAPQSDATREYFSEYIKDISSFDEKIKELKSGGMHDRCEAVLKLAESASK